jgi:hypothetical protein
MISVGSFAGGTLYLFNRRVTRFFRCCQQIHALLTMWLNGSSVRPAPRSRL